MGNEQYCDQDVASLYRTVLACHRDPKGHAGMDAYTERSLYEFQAEMKRRGLPLAEDDDTNPDEFAGFSTLVVCGKTLRDLFPTREAMKAILDHAFDVRAMEKASREGRSSYSLKFTATQVLSPYRSRIVECIGDFDEVDLAWNICERIQDFLDNQPPISGG